ncbi:SPOR domain-containing protein [uncultured Methylobacterium sp.]|uniref:SPOR domain-containing protein n=1 Tax=uncultured Methylobacterium sp. TaxID=157278 RepID=UPI0035CA0404
MTPNASRAPVDFDAFERELQQPAPRAAQPKGDPLAELARIVGQDDPFRALLQVRDARVAGQQAPVQQGGRIEPTFFEDAQAKGRTAHQDQAQHHPHQPIHEAGYDPAYGHAPEASPADAFNQYLASVEQGGYDAEGHPRVDGQGRHEQGHHGGEPDFVDDATAYRNVSAEKPRQRNRLVSVGAGLGVLVVCVTGALTWRSLHSGSTGGGGVPTIMADQAPLKIAPKTADGVEIPDQNKQIYDRNSKEGQIRIVNREEQPVDVAQAARAAQRPAENGTTPTTATPGASQAPSQGTPQGTLAESLGEPRRVRTVSVKPDTPPPAPQRETPAQLADTTPSSVPASVIPSMVMPGAGTDGTATTASLRPRTAKIAPPIATPAPETTAAVEVPPAPAPKPKTTQKETSQKVAALAPETAAAPAVTTGAVGGFSVQLGVRTSQAEAQAAFKQMQAKYSQLGGQPALIRQAEVNGKTIFRVRVGPLPKEEATSLCSQLQGAGGQCFVAKN